MKYEVHNLLWRLERLQRAKDMGAPDDIIAAISHSVMNIVSKLNANDLLMTHKIWPHYIRCLQKSENNFSELYDEQYIKEIIQISKNIQ